MARVKGPLYSESAVGRFGEIVFYRMRGRSYARSRADRSSVVYPNYLQVRQKNFGSLYRIFYRNNTRERIIIPIQIGINRSDIREVTVELKTLTTEERLTFENKLPPMFTKPGSYFLSLNSTAMYAPVTLTGETDFYLVKKI